MTDTKYIIGIDVGGTNMKAVLFDGQKVIDSSVLATPKDTLDHFLIMLKALIDPLLEKAKKGKHKITGIGIGVPGLCDYNEEIVLVCPNVSCLDNVKLPKIIEEQFGLPVKLDNDVNCFVRAEVLLGSALKLNNVFGLAIGTGIGGGWWYNNRIYQGNIGGAGEPGKMIVNFEDKKTLEVAYNTLSQNNPANLAEEAYRGDTLAQKAYKEIGQYIGVALANIVNLIDPEAIVLGGGVVESSDLFINETKEIIKEYVVHPESRKVKILESKLKDKAGSIGAALLFTNQKDEK